jgi:hypothetical protein
MRTSVLFGKTEAGVSTSSYDTLRSALSGQIFTYTSSSTASVDDDRDMVPVGELETGLEWTNNRFFVQGSIIGQSWFGLGTATSKQGNLGLFGGSFGAGIRF